MKLIIKKGESVANALQYLQDFLDEYSDEYPKLKSNMNVYITLEGDDRRICPENNKEFVLTKEKLVDVERVLIDKKRAETLEAWNHYYNTQMSRPISAEKAVALDLKYLETAEEKGRKPEAIEKRKKQLEQNKKAVEEAKKDKELAEKLNSLISEGCIRWFIQKWINRRSSYDYSIDLYLIFESEEVGCWYFETMNTKFYGYGYGGLHKGLPKNMAR